MSDAETRREEARKQAELRALADDEDVRAVLALPAGRRFVWRLLDKATTLFEASFAGEAPITSAYNEGRRSVGVKLMAELQRVDRGRYLEMLGEEMARLPPPLSTPETDE